MEEINESEVDDIFFLANVQFSLGYFMESFQTMMQIFQLRSFFDEQEMAFFDMVIKEWFDSMSKSIFTLTEKLAEDSQKMKNRPHTYNMLKDIISVRIESMLSNLLIVIGFVQDSLLSSCQNDESDVLCHKILGDLYKYRCEVQIQEKREKDRFNARTEYKIATETALNKLPSFNVIRIQSFFNYAIFTYDVLNDFPSAIQILNNLLIEFDQNRQINENDADIDTINKLKKAIQNKKQQWALKE